jgi:succinate dehydrogenase / fumarate reductase membrane anchor subunit
MKANRFWAHQRYSAILLLLGMPLSIAFLFLNRHGGLAHFTALLLNPFIAIPTVVFLWAGLYHGALGLHMIFQDYVHGPRHQILWLTCVWCLTVVLAFIVGLSIFKLYF